MLKLLAFVLPLGLDSFAVAAAIGAVQETTARQRLRISLRDSRSGGHAGWPHRPLCTVSAIGLRSWLKLRGGSSL